MSLNSDARHHLLVAPVGPTLFRALLPAIALAAAPGLARAADVPHAIVPVTSLAAVTSGWPGLIPGSPIVRVRFLVVDPVTRLPVPGFVTLRDMRLGRAPRMLPAGLAAGSPSPVFDLVRWSSRPGPVMSAVTVEIAAGDTIVLGQQPPIQDIYTKVTATRLAPPKAPSAGPATTIDRSRLQTFTTTGSNNLGNATKGQAGVASDSAGQQHVRGEHAEISYVVDGIPLPDTLSGRQSSVVVPSEIDTLDLLTGGYAPEFGGQTAAILNIATLPSSRKSHTEIDFEGGSFDTTDGELTTEGPIGKRAGYVIDVSGNRNRNFTEPQQPDNQTAHNTGSDQNYFAKLRYNPDRHDTLNLTLSQTPGTLQIGNRTGLPSSYADVGQGYGFLGLRDANGVLPGAQAGVFGSQTMQLASQNADRMDITQREVSEFATLAWKHDLSSRDTAQMALTLLHSGQAVHNNNPSVDLLNLPIDNSVEYNPSVVRNVHQVQGIGTVEAKRARHDFKAGILLDDQYGNESYNLTPASRLALDALVGLDPGLAPAGTIQMAGGKQVTDVNGNPVYTPTSSSAPTLQVHRSGFYRAGYAQDTWTPGRLTFNYGMRLDWYKQSENLGSAPVDTIEVSPRANFSYRLNRPTMLRWSYNRLFNAPPLAQGAIVGEAIKPETLDQYDVSLERHLGAGQTVRLAYYYKNARNQVDTGLLIPGSEIGIYSAVNFQYGGIHGTELSYDLTPPKGVGWDAYVNYSFSAAKPNGLDNTGAPAPQFNDHDQRNTLGAGAAYTWKSKASASLVFNYGSGLTSSIIRASQGRVPREQTDLHLSSGPKPFKGHGGYGLDVENVFDDRTVINFESGFSGTRFQIGRRILFSLFANF
jgi:outer membrane receptor protein involved in Fe transport